MPVNITIRVEDNGSTSLEVGGSPASTDTGAGEAPQPTLVAAPGEASAQVSDSGEAPPPMDLSDLGVSAAAEMASQGEGPPPGEMVEGGESDDSEAPEPMPVKDLDKSTSKSTRSKKS